MNKQKKGFTLVELIVVITILAILGTIAFLAFQGYSASARDSKRISDMNTIKTSLELFGLNSGKFPDPVNPVFINYSSGTINDLNLRQQGIFGQQNITNVSSAGKLDRLPKDPLTELEYTYSVTLNKKEFELGTILENDEVAFSPINLTNAASKKVVTAFIKGNYNGKILKTSSGTTSYIFAVPSIINSDATLTNPKNIIDLINNHLIVYNGFANLPPTYDGPTFEVNGAPNSNFVNINEILIFEGDTGNLILPDNSTPRIELLEAIKDAYSGTDLAGEGDIKNIVNLDITDPANPTPLEEYLAGLIANNDLGGNIKLVPVPIPDDTSGGEAEETLTHYNPQANWWTDDPDCELSTICDYTDGITDLSEDYCGDNECDCWWNVENDPVEESFCPVGGSVVEEEENCMRISFDSSVFTSEKNWEGNDSLLWNSTNNYWYFNPTTKKIYSNYQHKDLTYPGEYVYYGSLNFSDMTEYYRPEKVRITFNKPIINNLYVQGGGGDCGGMYSGNYSSNSSETITFINENCGLDTIYFKGEEFIQGIEGPGGDLNTLYYNTNEEDTHITNIEFCESELLACNDITQTVADNLNNLLGFSYTISEWCSLTSLDLSNKGLTTIPSDIGYLVNLKILLLNNNNLTNIPGNLSNLKNLITLDLSGNTGLLSFNQRFEGNINYGYCLPSIGITIESGDGTFSQGKVRIYDECMVY